MLQNISLLRVSLQKYLINEKYPCKLESGRKEEEIIPQNYQLSVVAHTTPGRHRKFTLYYKQPLVEASNISNCKICSHISLKLHIQLENIFIELLYTVQAVIYIKSKVLDLLGKIFGLKVMPVTFCQFVFQVQKRALVKLGKMIFISLPKLFCPNQHTDRPPQIPFQRGFFEN